MELTKKQFLNNSFGKKKNLLFISTDPSLILLIIYKTMKFDILTVYTYYYFLILKYQIGIDTF